jgi:DNA primase catalytic core
VAIWPPEQRQSRSWPGGSASAQLLISDRAGLSWLEASHHPTWSLTSNVWRAAMGVSPDDRRPTGPVQRHKVARIWQRGLDQAVAASLAPAWREWAPLVEQEASSVRDDSFAPILAGRLAALSLAGVDIKELLGAVIGQPLPDDHAAAALWWRICRHLHPALSAQIDRSPDPVSEEERCEPHRNSWSDGWRLASGPAVDESPVAAATDTHSAIAPSSDPAGADPADGGYYLEPDLAVAAMLRDVAGLPEQTDADVDRMFTRAMAWRECPVSRERMVEVNQLSLDYFRRHFPYSWGQHYLADRLGEDITDDPRFQPGQAPAGWTNLVDHLRHRGVSDEEMTITGVAVTASTGRLIDRFRDRVVFPIIHDGQILGFVGRRRPDLSDAGRAGPKYLNTGDTPLFHKGAQLFGALESQLPGGAITVIVEGPMDAIAVTLASQGRYIGIAPLGTSLTDEQAHQLAGLRGQPIVATDADLAGRIAAERDFWMLSCYRLDPLYAQLPDGTDPADLLAVRGPTALTDALAAAQPLAERLIDERLENLPPAEALLEATRVVAARPSRHWDQGSTAISSRLGAPMVQVRHALRTLVNEWNTNPRRAAQQPMQAIGAVKRRMSRGVEVPAEQRRTVPARDLSQRLDPDAMSMGNARSTKPEDKQIPLLSRARMPRTRLR